MTDGETYAVFQNYPEGFRCCVDGDTHFIESHERVIVQPILRHDSATVTRIYTQYDSEAFDDYRDPEAALPLSDDEYVIGVAARLPIGTMTIKGSPRSNNGHSTIVNTPADAQSAREAFQE